MATTTPGAGATTLELKPYIFFYGRCEEALEFYKKVFGGTYEMQRITGSPMEEHTPADFRDKVMHASFTAPGIAFFASDGAQAKKVDPDEGNVSLCINAPDKAKADRIFAALSEGGKVTMPLQEAFWGGRFGSVQDRFGTEWMMTSP
jgi:PhnB protein